MKTSLRSPQVLGLGAFLSAKRIGQTASPNEACIPTRDPESHLFPVAHSQNGDEWRVQTLPGNIAAVTKIDHPVSELIVHVFDRPPETWLLFQHFDPLAIRPDGAFRSVWILEGQKAVKKLHIERG